MKWRKNLVKYVYKSLKGSLQFLHFLSQSPKLDYKTLPEIQLYPHNYQPNPNGLKALRNFDVKYRHQRVHITYILFASFYQSTAYSTQNLPSESLSRLFELLKTEKIGNLLIIKINQQMENPSTHLSHNYNWSAETFNEFRRHSVPNSYQKNFTMISNEL